MQTLSRRSALLAGAAALATTATVAPVAIKSAQVKAALSGDPVIGLVVQLRATWRAWNDADDAYEDAAHARGYSVCADTPMVQVRTSDGGTYLWAAEEIRRATAPGIRYGALTQGDAERYLAEAEARQREADRIRRDLGLDPLKADVDRCRALHRDLTAQVLDMPARTLPGVLAKFAACFGEDEIASMREGGESCDDLPSEWVASIYRDLEALAGEARS
jgi:hypothetical protein